MNKKAKQEAAKETTAKREKPAKPATLAMSELRGAVANAINNSGLTPVLVEAAVKDVFTEISRQAMIQRASEAEAYLAAVKEFEEKDNEYNVKNK